MEPSLAEEGLDYRPRCVECGMRIDPALRTEVLTYMQVSSEEGVLMREDAHLCQCSQSMSIPDAGRVRLWLNPIHDHRWIADDGRAGVIWCPPGTAPGALTHGEWARRRR